MTRVGRRFWLSKMTTKKKRLPDRFPDAAYVGRLKLWTPDRNIMEMEAGFPEVVGDLLLMASCVGAGTVKPRHEKAMRECLAVLWPEQYGKKAKTPCTSK